MLLLIVFAFIAGIVTVLSPCILPVLPIVLSGGVGGGRRRPAGIITGFVLSFTFFTLFVSLIVRSLGIPADVLRFASVVIIAVFGFTLIIPQLQTLVERLFQKFNGFAPQSTRTDFLGGILIGLSLGLLWTPCVGPILAAVISLAATGTVSISAVFLTFAYALGTAIPMFAIMWSGGSFLRRHSWLQQRSEQIQRGFGVIMILTAVAIARNWDRQFQSWVLQTFPGYGVGLTALEESPLISDQLSQLRVGSASNQDMGKPLYTLQQGDREELPVLFTAPELQVSGEWFNSPPLSLSQLRGQVVLIDFWTYSCINCIRTLPYLKDWYQRYHDQGFEIIGVHSPEFEFEKKASNVATAIEDFELTYPIMQDNEFLTWRAYENRYWPAKYLIDQQGRVRYIHFGEGKYAETENAIRLLLGEQPLALQKDPSSTTNRRQTPETYLGYERAESYVNQGLELDKEQQLSLPPQIPINGVGLGGTWYLGSEYIESRGDDAVLEITFSAANVYLVMELAENTDGGEVSLMLDAESLPSQYLTQDTTDDGKIEVQASRKYDLVDLGETARTHRLRLTLSPGVRAFAFTFGS